MSRALKPQYIQMTVLQLHDTLNRSVLDWNAPQSRALRVIKQSKYLTAMKACSYKGTSLSEEKLL